MYKYILFDLDGTLIDSRAGITTAVQYALHKMGVEEPDLKKLEVFIGPPLSESFPEYYGYNKEQTELAVRYFREFFSRDGIRNNTLVEGVPEMLRTLKEHKKVLCIASSKPEIFVREILGEQHQIAELFDCICGGSVDESRCKKTDVLRELLDGRLKLSREQRRQVLMVGDRKYDVSGAAQFGIPCLGVDMVDTPKGELEAAGAIEVVHDMKAVTDFILR